MARKLNATENGIDGPTGGDASETGSGELENKFGSGSDENGIGSVESGNIENASDIEKNPPKPETVTFTEPTKKRRGRPPGTGTAKTKSSERAEAPQHKLDSVTKKATPKQIDQLAQLYRGANNFAALNYKSPDFVISEAEALKIAAPLADILVEYGIIGDAFESPWIKLAMAGVGVYGHRVIMRVMLEKQTTMTQAVRPATPSEAAVRENFKGTVDFSADIGTGAMN